MAKKKIEKEEVVAEAPKKRGRPKVSEGRTKCTKTREEKESNEKHR